MKNRLITFFFCIILLLIVVPGKVFSRDYFEFVQQDTVHSFAGKVIDKDTRRPIIFATIFIANTRIGTVTNSEGDFLIKVPDILRKGDIGVTHLGYSTLIVPISSLEHEGNVLELAPAKYPIKEVVIRNEDPLELMRQAVNNINENYSGVPVMMTSFYRETIKQNRSYVAIAEAVLEAYKASYKKTTEGDRVRVFQGRKSQDVKKMDTIIFKFQGGPYTSYLLDVAKQPGELLTPEAFKFYDYTMRGIVSIHETMAYVIEFDQKDIIDFPLYSGRIYLDTENLAIVGLEFSISKKRIEQASDYLIRKKPLGLNVDVASGNYLVNYRKIDDLWYLAYVRTELKFQVKWKKKLFRSTYITTSEMAITDFDTDHIDKFKMKETAKLTDVFVDNVTDMEDPDFWGDYNIIKPEESIEAAIEKLSKKLKRRTE
ncbi:MAG: carboxypeptidase-like regulatory domain-containing protein [Bacteroidales bacterium]|nr:carboxypeptidase-like regulatory domain-containing protein [Bacteroidales bacterium]